MRPWVVVFAPQAAAEVRGLPPDVKRAVREAQAALSSDPFQGKELVRDLQGLWSHRARRYRIVYEVVTRDKALRVVAVAHRSTVYEDLARARIARRPRGRSQG